MFFFVTRGGADASKIKSTTVEEKSITSQVSASGIVKSDEQVDLKFPAVGKIVWVGVEEGDFVTKGQAIAQLDKEGFEIALRKAQQDVVAADAALEQAYDSLNDDNNVESFADKVSRTAAEKTKNQAFDNLKQAEKNLRESTLYAPFSGTLTSLSIAAGQELLITTIVGQIANLTDIVFLAEVDETQIGKIEVGQQAEITLDAFDDTINSSVSKIANSSITTSTGATGFETTLNLPDEEKFRLGMNGEALITTQRSPKTLVVPIEALVDGNFVYLKTNGVYEKTEVQTGIESDFEIEITKGLKENDQILISGFEEIDKKSTLDRILRR